MWGPFLADMVRSRKKIHLLLCLPNSHHQPHLQRSPGRNKVNLINTDAKTVSYELKWSCLIRYQVANPIRGSDINIHLSHSPFLSLITGNIKLQSSGSIFNVVHPHQQGARLISVHVVVKSEAHVTTLMQLRAGQLIGRAEDGRVRRVHQQIISLPTERSVWPREVSSRIC